MKIRLLVAAAALLIPLAAAQPASAALPSSCHLSAGKLVAWTATTTRSVDARWPGMACATPAYLWITAQLWQDQAGKWVGGTVTTVEYTPTMTTSLPGGSAVFHCTHRAPVQLRMAYWWHQPGVGASAGFARTNVTTCS
jgi:hypothetical protein